ncbi:type 1 glutamine amidotransferase domain-containing protein [Aliarcobacter butzleri]|uniref:type 1 glutamine amidotransferase domain-containing protein n=1 Tax=Aliarcobacter butzleri TaxID=28197 RepID=UPI0021B49223|nr:type 1 glutamine amidotransferase domain-containing protein [Aliarcobacter butzleri]MCT7555128.1 type 1 glutamine amidotransferase domain-containing protein [Aliarcobacter butzleri]
MNTIFSILIIVTTFSNISENQKTGVWFEEYAIPYQTFKEKNYNITVATIDGKDIPIDPNSMPKDQTKWKTELNSLKNSVKLSQVDLSKYDAVYIPGGHGAIYDLPKSKEVKEAIEYFANKNKVVASVCHGPASFININLSDGTPFVKGKTLTSFTNKEEKEANLIAENELPFYLETELSKKGAIFIQKPNWSDHIEVSENLITGQNPKSSKSVALAIVDKLESKEK